MKAIATYGSLDEAQVVASFLEGSGLSPNVRDVHTASIYIPQVIGGVVLEVPDLEYEKALELMGLPTTTEASLKCPNCGSSEVEVKCVGWMSQFTSLITISPSSAVSRKATCSKCKQVFQFR